VTQEEWMGLTGEFRSFPLGLRKIGQVAATAESVLLSDLESNPPWLAHPEWANREGICVFAGHPLLFRGEVLGVLGVFGTQPIAEEQFRSSNWWPAPMPLFWFLASQEPGKNWWRAPYTREAIVQLDPW
jgi:GAF domain-containing protein